MGGLTTERVVAEEAEWPQPAWRPTRFSAHRVFMADVAGLLELECAVVDIKAARETPLQLIEERGQIVVLKACVVDDYMGTHNG
jgi:hypothetical protein